MEKKGQAQRRASLKVALILDEISLFLFFFLLVIYQTSTVKMLQMKYKIAQNGEDNLFRVEF